VEDPSTTEFEQWKFDNNVDRFLIENREISGNQGESAFPGRQVQISVQTGRARAAGSEFHGRTGQNAGVGRRVWMRQEYHRVFARTVLRSVERSDRTSSRFLNARRLARVTKRR